MSNDPYASGYVITDENRKRFADSLTSYWDTRLMEKLSELWVTDQDGVPEINRLFADYFDRNSQRFEGLPWRQVLDETFVALFGYSALTIADRAGMLEEENDNA